MTDIHRSDLLHIFAIQTTLSQINSNSALTESTINKSWRDIIIQCHDCFWELAIWHFLFALYFLKRQMMWRHVSSASRWNLSKIVYLNVFEFSVYHYVEYICIYNWKVHLQHFCDCPHLTLLLGTVSDSWISFVSIRFNMGLTYTEPIQVF